MEKPLLNKYHQFTKAGYQAAEALRAAKIARDWEDREWDEWGEFDEPQIGEVRLRLEPEQESYFDVYGEPEEWTDVNGRHYSAEEERERICDQIERLGCWCAVSEYWNGARWQVIDSIGMLVGYRDPLSPIENAYIMDMMQAAIEAAIEAEEREAYRIREEERLEEAMRKWGDWRLDLMADDIEAA